MLQDFDAGSADVPVGTANEQASGQAENGTSLSPHSHANEDVGVPGTRDPPCRIITRYRGDFI